jgi:hypothetical protein
LGHGPDEAVGLACLGGACDIGIAGLECAVADVLRDRVIEEGNLLRDQGDARSERLRLDIGDRNAIDRHDAGLRVVEAQDQVEDRALAGSRRAHERDRLSAPYGESHPVEG